MKRKLNFAISFFSSHVYHVFPLYFFSTHFHRIPTKWVRNYFHVDCILYLGQTPWTADFSLPNCLVALCWQGWIHSILFLVGKHLILNLQTSLLLRKSYFPIAQCCFNLFPRSLGQCHPHPNPPSPSPAVLWPGSRPPAAFAGSSETAFTQLLKGQISSIVSSLSAFSNHSHGFCALHPNCAFDYWGHFVPSAFPEVTEISCVQSRLRESGGLSHSFTSIDFPSVWEWQGWLLFPFCTPMWQFPCSSIPLLGGKLSVRWLWHWSKSRKKAGKVPK